MAKLFLKNAYEFENPSRRIFLAGELFEGSGEQAKKTKDYFKNGESTPEAIALAKRVEQQAAEIREGTNHELLTLYVDLFHSLKIPERSNLSGPETKVDAKYSKQGILAVAADICPMLGSAYKDYPELQLLSYATVFNNLRDDKGNLADANKLPETGASERVENGIVYVTYPVDGVETTFHSELFPWNSYDAAYAKWLANNAEEAARREAEFQAHGRPDDGLDADGAPIVRTPPEEVPGTVEPPAPETLVPPGSAEAVREKSEYEKRLDAKVDTFRDDHGLIDKGDRIGLQIKDGTASYVASLKKPDGTVVSVIVRATVPDAADQDGLQKALEKELDAELARLDKTLDKVEDPRDAALNTEWLTKVKPGLQKLESQFPGTKITFRDASFVLAKDKPSDEVDRFPNYDKHGKTLSIQYGPKKTDVKRYQILVPKSATSYLDPSVVITEDVNEDIGITWKNVDMGAIEGLYDYFTGEVDQLTKNAVADSLRAGDIAHLNELPPASQLYYLEWYVSRTLSLVQKIPAERSEAEQKALYEFYRKGVEVEASEKWYFELNPKLPSDDPGLQARLKQVEDNIRLLQGLRRSRPYEGMSENEKAGFEMDALFTVDSEKGKLELADGSSWEKIDAQYQKLLSLMPNEQISALHHFRGAQAAADAGRIDDCNQALNLALINAEKGSKLEGDIILYQAYFKKNFGPVSLTVARGTTLSFTAAKKDASIEGGALYDTRAIEVAQAALKATGTFNGLLPVGIYTLGEGKTLTVTPEGGMVKETPVAPAVNVAPAAAPVAPTGVPGLKEGRYTKIAPAMITLDPENPHSGLVELEWADGTTFQGELKNGVPDGMGILDLGGADETFGPVVFKNGVAEITLTGGIKKTLTWDAERAIFNIKE